MTTTTTTTTHPAHIGAAASPGYPGKPGRKTPADAGIGVPDRTIEGRATISHELTPEREALLRERWDGHRATAFDLARATGIPHFVWMAWVSRLGIVPDQRRQMARILVREANHARAVAYDGAPIDDETFTYGPMVTPREAERLGVRPTSQMTPAELARLGVLADDANRDDDDDDDDGEEVAAR